MMRVEVPLQVQPLEWLLAAFRLAQHPTKYIIDCPCTHKKGQRN